MTPSARDILESPNFYPLAFEGANLVFVRMSPASYQQSIFTLPNRIVRSGDESWELPIAQVVEWVETADKNLPPPAFIFQIAHCGSTLLSRALDRPDASLVIREPFALRQLIASPSAEGLAAQGTRRRALTALLYLYSRRYQENERILIKANVPVNYGLPEILDLLPQADGILLYSDFDDYLMGVLKSQKRRMWAMHVIHEMADRIQTLDSFADIDFAALIPAQATAVLWLSQLNLYQTALLSNNNLRTLNSNTLYQHPSDTLTAARSHLGIDMSDEEIKQTTESDLFSLHAKNPEQAYSEDQRQQELARLKKRYRAKIDSTLAWCDKSGFDIAASLSGRLSDNQLI